MLCFNIYVFNIYLKLSYKLINTICQKLNKNDALTKNNEDIIYNSLKNNAPCLI